MSFAGFYLRSCSVNGFLKERAATAWAAEVHPHPETPGDVESGDRADGLFEWMEVQKKGARRVDLRAPWKI